MKRWTEKEDFYLEEKWGRTSIKKICRILNRTESSVMHRARKKKLGGIYKTGDYYLATDVARILGVNKTTVCYWIKNKGLKANRVKYISQERLLIEHSDLLKWLEENPKRWTANRLEFYALGLEPEWLKEKRRVDLNKKYAMEGYTDEEDQRIISLYKMDYKIKDIAEEVGRTEDMIKHRLKKLRKLGINIPYKNAGTHSLH